ncbi:hypothetical protein [Acanthopleuribacter pedis]|uniref:Uncharacterized protein n=1 Tax=Acanthopleuribacter pedis TaxID=442870 RepID=A0A8J7QPT2_9BACT|nr:hypothetical protein [Acanthopleuribacter pedis]MBO1321895.1 hypothetical protein [Acanthopleuribacter pedis]
MKYASIVLALPDNELFTPAKIFRFALDHDLLKRFGRENMAKSGVSKSKKRRLSRPLQYLNTTKNSGY